MRTRSGRDIADMATALWEGPWEELVQCHRQHPDARPATTTPTYSPPTIGAYQRTPRRGERRRKPVEAITISDSSDSIITGHSKPPNASGSERAFSAGIKFAPGANGPSNSAPPVLRPRVLLSSPRKSSTNPPAIQRSTSMGNGSTKPPSVSSNKENNGPARNLRSASRPIVMTVLEQESDADLDEHKPPRCVRATAGTSSSGVSSGRNSYVTATAHSSGGGSYRSARSRGSSEYPASPLPGPEPAPQRAVVNVPSTNTRAIALFWLAFQQITRGICLWISLDPFFDPRDDNIDSVPHHLRERSWWPALRFACTTLVARDIMLSAINQARDDD